MITIKESKDLFLTSKNTLKAQKAYLRGKPLSYYLKEHNVKNKRVIVLGKVETDFSKIPHDNTEIIIVPSIRDIVTPIVLAVTFIGGGSLLMGVLTLVMIGYAIYSYMNRPRIPKFNAGNDESSPTYSWDGIHTLQDVGVPVPVVYGRHKIGGNIVNQYMRSEGDASYLNLLIALAEGEINSISDIKVNGNAIENYSNITHQTRMGTVDQEVISNFNELHNLQSMNVVLTKDVPYVYTTVRNDVETFELYLNFPAGLYYVNEKGSVRSWDAQYRVEYKLHEEDEEDYIDLGLTDVYEQNRTPFKRVFRKTGLTAGQYDIRVTKTSDESDVRHFNDISLVHVDEIINDDIAYRNTALLSIETMATDQLSGSTPDFTCVIEGKKVLMPVVVYNGSPVDWEDYYWDDDSECYRLFLDDSECTWDGVSYDEKWGANPIWCLRDFMLNKRYGLGDDVENADVDLDFYLEQSRICERKVPDGRGGYEKRYRLDVVIDSLGEPMDWFIKLSSSFDGLVFYSQGIAKIKIDKEEEITQVFGMDRIIPKTFKQSVKSIRDVPNALEIQFLNEEKDYAQDTVVVVNDEALNVSTPLRIKQIRLFVTKPSYAIRLGKRALKVAMYLSRQVSFKTGINGFVSTPGQVVGVSHDIPLWGFSGSVITGSDTTHIKLDRVIELEPKTYHILIQYEDDTIEEKLVLNEAGETNEIVVDSEFSKAPEAGCSYVINIISTIVKPFRLLEVQRDNRCEVDLKLLEYRDEVYVDDLFEIPDDNYSLLSSDWAFVENISLRDRVVLLGDGTIENAIDVYFNKPNFAQSNTKVRGYQTARIYISDNDGESWQYKGSTFGESFSIVGGIDSDTTYKVAVVSVAGSGEEAPIDRCPQENIMVVGKAAPPSDVTTFIVNQNRDNLIFSWTHITDVDLAGYEIRRGTDWDTGYVLASNIKTNRHTILDFQVGELSYFIKAIDTSGNYSENATEATITVGNIPFQNVYQIMSEVPDWIGDMDGVGTDISGNLLLTGTNLEGTYTSILINLSRVASYKIDIRHTILDMSGGGFTWESFAGNAWSDLGNVKWNQLGSSAGGNANFEIRTSLDGVEWTEWVLFQYASEYNCRYFQVKTTMSRASVDQIIAMTQLDYFIDLPDIDDFNNDSVTVAGDGAEVLFSKDFTFAPPVHITILSGDGVYYKIISLDETGFTIKLYDINGSAVTGDFYWHAHGI